MAAGGDITLVNNPNAFAQIAGPVGGNRDDHVRGLSGDGACGGAGGRHQSRRADATCCRRRRASSSSSPQARLRRQAAVSPSPMSDASPAGVPIAAHSAGKDVIRTPVQRSALDAIHIGDADTGAADRGVGRHHRRHLQPREALRGVRGPRHPRRRPSTARTPTAARSASVRAGRDVALPDAENGIQLGGPGRLTVLAGRNVDLGFSARHHDDRPHGDDRLAGAIRRSRRCLGRTRRQPRFRRVQRPLLERAVRSGACRLLGASSCRTSRV